MGFSENVRNLRRLKGWSQSELAKKLGCHFTHINRIETDKYVPSLKTAVQIAKLFSVPLDSLVKGKIDMEESQTDDSLIQEVVASMQKLDKEEQKFVLKVMDAIVTKKKLVEVLK